MKYVRLIGFVSEVTGETGLGFKGHTSHPNLVGDIDGRLIAHDIVEHQNGLAAIGCPADELQALGALWHIRGEAGMLGNTYYSPEQSLAHDVESVFHDLLASEDEWLPRIGQYRTHQHECDDVFDEIIKHAGKAIERSESDYDHFDRDMFNAFLENAKHLMRIGHNKSQRRWGNQYYGTDTFNRIQEAVSEHAPHAEEGQEFILGYGGGEATCRELEWSEYEYG